MRQNPIITCAITGSADTVDKSPAVPVSPAQIADSALAAAEAGAAIVHLHVREPETGQPSMRLDLYEETVALIRERNQEVIVNLTTGAGARFVPDEARPQVGAPGTTLEGTAKRMEHVLKIRPDICTLDVGSMNFGEHVFVNTPGHLRTMASEITKAGVTIEAEVFDLGHIRLARRLLDEGVFHTRPIFQLCLGVPWGAEADPATLLQMRDRLPQDVEWSAFGIGAMQFPMVAQSWLAGGHVRVGLEDNLYIARGELADSNAQLVRRAVDILASLGASPASATQARTLLGL
ncbi:3-keto-5-aminohexanoate cleavage protein [Microbaculum marinisediminis]|uniref:3-keto-5-aminohexanoate cleavage protein n=1 Tax=Microbaculum marinisediminis TaxID=2931392 RepID=A0AAW5QYD9_9HYPH|nr:3-keto-5-aminohexanoate cleavage protein [Microbaculum sp. A6E488]MCT8971374.1 3-keto-5-aminohexanoate cleavage protein [Microbaculum sp. A6E488]